LRSPFKYSSEFNSEQPNNPGSYYQGRQIVSGDRLGDLERAKIVITNYHAFKLRERRGYQGWPFAASGAGW
jgi:hypothetical protein